MISGFRHDAIKQRYQLSYDVTFANDDVTIHDESVDRVVQAQRMSCVGLPQTVLP